LSSKHCIVSLKKLGWKKQKSQKIFVQSLVWLSGKRMFAEGQAWSLRPLPLTSLLPPAAASRPDRARRRQPPSPPVPQRGSRPLPAPRRTGHRRPPLHASKSLAAGAPPPLPRPRPGQASWLLAEHRCAAHPHGPDLLRPWRRRPPGPQIRRLRCRRQRLGPRDPPHAPLVPDAARESRAAKTTTLMPAAASWCFVNAWPPRPQRTRSNLLHLDRIGCGGRWRRPRMIKSFKGG
jgi:hypothetical protein